MFLLQRPTREAIDRFIAASSELPLSYGPVGLARDDRLPPDRDPDLDYDEIVAPIGRGEGDLIRARAALRAWKQFEVGWVDLHPPGAGIATGTNVAVVIRHLGFCSMNGCRVVYEVGDPRNGGRFGFAYGTLPNHAESGEELFEVWLDAGINQVMYRLRAVSRPRAPLARMGYRIARHLQARFRLDSVAAMRRAVAGNPGNADDVKP